MYYYHQKGNDLACVSGSQETVLLEVDFISYFQLWLIIIPLPDKRAPK